VSPHRFLVQRQIEQARPLLAAQTPPIAEIARSVGFREPSHFMTTFRRVTDITPSVYCSGGKAKSAKASNQERKTSAAALHVSTCGDYLQGDPSYEV